MCYSRTLLVRRFPKVLQLKRERTHNEPAGKVENNGSHWGWGATYPVGTLWVHCGFWCNSPPLYPVGPWWVFYERTHQFDLIIPSGYIVDKFVGILWKNPQVSFTMYPVATLMGYFWKRSQSTHWVWSDQIDGFFHKIPTMDPLGIVGTNCTRTHNVPTMYLLGKWPLAPSVYGLKGSRCCCRHETNIGLKGE